MLVGFTSPLYAPDSDGGDGGASGGNEERPAWAVNFERRLQQMNGDATRLAEQLYRDNFAQRERIRELEGRTPAEGAVVLTTEQAQQWQAYQQLGAPDAIAQERERAQQAQQRAAELERQQTLRAAAESAGYKPNVLAKLPDLPPVEVSDEGAFVVPAEGQRVALTDYVADKYADFLPALAIDAQSSPRTPYPAQGSGTNQAQKPVDSYLNKVYGPRKTS